ncbi:MAG: hypothetical protein ACRDG3_12175, partial [Tepidiformaceae bacterium]
MASRIFNLVFKGDASQLQAVMQTVGGATEELGGKVATMAGHFADVTATAAGFLTSAAIQNGPGILEGLVGSSTALNDSLAAAQLVLLPFSGQIEEFVSAQASAIAEKYVPSLIAAASAGWAFVTEQVAQAAAVIAANLPLIAIVAVIALIVAGVILLVTHWDEITQKFPILGTVADNVKAALQTFVDWITGTLVPAVQKIPDAAQAVKDWVVEH